MTCTPNGSSTTLITFVPDDSAAVRPMPAVRLFSVTQNALPALNIIRCVLLLSKSSADVSTGLPASATAVRNPSAAVPFPINIFTMPALHIVSMRSFALLPDRAPISPAMRLCRVNRSPWRMRNANKHSREYYLLKSEETRAYFLHVKADWSMTGYLLWQRMYHTELLYFSFCRLQG